MVQRIMQVFVDCAKEAPQTKLIALLEHVDVATLLAKAQVEVEDGVRNSEYLQVLTDTITDCRQAPEWLGRVVKALLEADACRIGVLFDIVVENKKINIDELMSPSDVTDKVYDRFMAVVTSEGDD